MSEKGANIDLLFRNGLKDFEVLPPPGVWDGISASNKIKKRPIIFYRIAAVSVVLLAAGFLIFRLSHETGTFSDQVLAFDIRKSSPIVSNEIIHQEKVPSEQIADISPSSPSDRTDYMNPVSIEGERVTMESILPLDAGINPTIAKSESSVQSFLNPLNSSGSKILDVRYADLQFMPEDKLADRWSIAAMASPTYYSQFSSGNDAFSKQLMESEQPLVSYSGGVAFLI